MRKTVATSKDHVPSVLRTSWRFVFAAAGAKRDVRTTDRAEPVWTSRSLWLRTPTPSIAARGMRSSESTTMIADPSLIVAVVVEGQLNRTA